MLDRIGSLKAVRKVGKEGIWKVASSYLKGPRSRMAAVNVGKISRVADDGSVVFVLGKVLGGGMIQKKLVVGAFSFSFEARRKITEAGGEALEMEEFVKRYSKKRGGIIIVGG